jgi:hypothetical protein
MLGWSGVYVKEGTRILFYVLSSEVMSGASLEELKSGTCVSPWGPTDLPLALVDWLVLYLSNPSDS